MKTKKTILAVLFLAVSYSICYSQPILDWEDNYNAGGTGTEERVSKIAVDDSGNVYATGYSDSISTNINIVTVKYRPDGTRAWVNRYDYTGLHDRGLYITLDPSGYVYVTGTVSVSSTNMDIIIIKYKPNGNIEWVKRLIPSGYTGVGIEEPKGLIYEDGYLFIAGNIQENEDIALFRVNSSTSAFTSTTYGSAGGRQWVYDIAKTSTSDIYICGQSSIVSSKGLVIRYTNYLAPIWSKELTDTIRTDRLTFTDIKINSLGNIVVSGHATNYLPVQKRHIVTTQIFKGDGNTIWYKRFSSDSSYSNIIYSMVIDNNNNSILCGSAPLSRGLIFKYNNAGVFLWSKTIDTLAQIRTLCTDVSNNIYVAGYSRVYVPNAKNFGMFDQNGILKWRGTTNSVWLNGSIFVSPKYLYLCGIGYGVPGYNLYTAKFVISSTSGKPTKEIGEKYIFKLHENYPNPFNPSTSIKYSVPSTGLVTLKVFDVTGKEAATLVDGNVEQGEHEVNFNASHLASGVYFYKLISGSFTEVKKMILVK